LSSLFQILFAKLRNLRHCKIFQEIIKYHLQVKANPQG